MAKVELKKKWWVTNKPKTVKGAELEKALGLVESTEGDKQSAALSALGGAINKARSELDKKAHKDLLKDLDTLESMAQAEIKELAAAAAKAKAAAAKAAKEQEKEKDKESAEGEDDEETPAEKLFDPELHRGTLKRALRQSLVFAFSVGSKPELRHLALAPRGNAMKFGRLAKERAEGTRAISGRLQAAPGEANKLLLMLENPPLPGSAKLFRMYLKENKLTQFKKVAILVNGQESESASMDDDEGAEAAAEGAAPEAAAAAAAAPAAPAAPAPAPAAAAPAAPAAPAAAAPAAAAGPAPTPEQAAAAEDRRREFKRARAAWVAVKTRAEQDLEKVKDGARMAYMSDLQQWPKVVAGCKAIDDILDNLDDELRDTLDQYASTPLRNQKRLQELAATAGEVLERYQRFVASNTLMRAIDEKEFADVEVHAPVTKALADLRKALA